MGHRSLPSAFIAKHLYEFDRGTPHAMHDGVSARSRPCALAVRAGTVLVGCVSSVEHRRRSDLAAAGREPVPLNDDPTERSKNDVDLDGSSADISPMPSSTARNSAPSSRSGLPQSTAHGGRGSSLNRPHILCGVHSGCRDPRGSTAARPPSHATVSLADRAHGRGHQCGSPACRCGAAPLRTESTRDRVEGLTRRLEDLGSSTSTERSCMANRSSWRTCRRSEDANVAARHPFSDSVGRALSTYADERRRLV